MEQEGKRKLLGLLSTRPGTPTTSYPLLLLKTVTETAQIQEDGEIDDLFLRETVKPLCKETCIQELKEFGAIFLQSTITF